VYEEASTLAPDYLTWISLGFLYEGAERWRDAITAYGEAAAALPEDALAYAARGSVFQRLGRYEEGVSDLELAVQIDSGNAFYWEALAMGYAALERPDDAWQAADETLQRNPESVMAYLVRGGVHESRGEMDEARADYEKVRVLAGADVTVQQLVQEALQRVGG